MRKINLEHVNDATAHTKADYMSLIQLSITETTHKQWKLKCIISGSRIEIIPNEESNNLSVEFNS